MQLPDALSLILLHCRFIDYEYAGFNPVALDIANHWCEYAGSDLDTILRDGRLLLRKMALCGSQICAHSVEIGGHRFACSLLQQEGPESKK